MMPVDDGTKRFLQNFLTNSNFLGNLKKKKSARIKRNEVDFLVKKRIDVHEHTSLHCVLYGE